MMISYLCPEKYLVKGLLTFTVTELE